MDREQLQRYAPSLFLGVVGALFVLQNTDETRFEFVTVDFDAPTWVMLLVFAAIGGVIGYVLGRRRGGRGRDD